MSAREHSIRRLMADVHDGFWIASKTSAGNERGQSQAKEGDITHRG
jgi:hypothetical protein